MATTQNENDEPSGGERCSSEDENDYIYCSVVVVLVWPLLVASRGIASLMMRRNYFIPAKEER